MHRRGPGDLGPTEKFAEGCCRARGMPAHEKCISNCITERRYPFWRKWTAFETVSVLNMKYRTIRIGFLFICFLTLLAISGCANRKENAISALHHFNRGNEAFRIEDYGRAIRQYRLALKLDPQAASIHYNLGLAHLKVETHRGAVRAFLRALEINPRFADAHYNLAIAYDKLYEVESAHAHLNAYRDLVAQEERKREGLAAGAAGAAVIPAGRRIPPPGGVFGNRVRRAGQQFSPKGGGITFGKRPGSKQGISAASGRGAGPANRAGGAPGRRPGAANRAKGFRGKNAFPLAGGTVPSRPPRPTQKSNKLFGGSGKWWIQDLSNQNR